MVDRTSNDAAGDSHTVVPWYHITRHSRLRGYGTWEEMLLLLPSSSRPLSLQLAGNGNTVPQLIVIHRVQDTRPSEKPPAGTLQPAARGFIDEVLERKVIT